MLFVFEEKSDAAILDAVYPGGGTKVFASIRFTFWRLLWSLLVVLAFFAAAGRAALVALRFGFELDVELEVFVLVELAALFADLDEASLSASDVSEAESSFVLAGFDFEFIPLSCCFKDCVGVEVSVSSSLESTTRSALLNSGAMLERLMCTASDSCCNSVDHASNVPTLMVIWKRSEPDIRVS